MVISIRLASKGDIQRRGPDTHGQHASSHIVFYETATLVHTPQAPIQ